MKRKYIFLMAICLSIILYIIHPFFLSTEVIGVHSNGYRVDIVVKNFPVTDKGRIAWWKENKTQLKTEYNIPVVDPDDGGFDISIWDLGDGYKKEEPKRDWMAPSRDTSYLICFDDMKTDVNCVEKEMLISIIYHRDPWHQEKMVTDFFIGDDNYRQYEDSENVIKIEKKKFTYQ